MSTLLDFYKKKFVVLFITSIVMSLGVQYFSSSFNFSGVDMTDPYALIEKFKEFIWPMVYISVISLLFTLILQYYIIYNPIDSSISIFSSAYKSLKYLFPYLIILILFAFFGSFAMIAGFFALVIGMFFAALYLATLYLFVLPILMVEGPLIGNTISRTFKLAHRNFWSNIGWVAVFILITLVFSFIFSSLILIPFTGSFLKAISNPDEVSNIMNFTSNPIYIILSSVVNAFVVPVMPLLGAILYFNGKAREEIQETLPSENTEPDRVKVEDLYAKPLPENTKNEEKV
jgi:hypothetical protein